mmetsp:Transcript_50038/g.122912  ORF Transcript_50038/g.122912 Transcript_50038/m.122912 type:complete len:327 (-) Transcript_50038:1743-2723(-)
MQRAVWSPQFLPLATQRASLPSVVNALHSKPFTAHFCAPSAHAQPGWPAGHVATMHLFDLQSKPARQRSSAHSQPGEPGSHTGDVHTLPISSHTSLAESHVPSALHSQPDSPSVHSPVLVSRHVSSALHSAFESVHAPPAHAQPLAPGVHDGANTHTLVSAAHDSAESAHFCAPAAHGQPAWPATHVGGSQNDVASLHSSGASHAGRFSFSRHVQPRVPSRHGASVPSKIEPTAPSNDVSRGLSVTGTVYVSGNSATGWSPPAVPSSAAEPAAGCTSTSAASGSPSSFCASTLPSASKRRLFTTLSAACATSRLRICLAAALYGRK